ncbi:hypothetical protein GOD83_24565 [Sinorhizobium medicae]|nr:hypothetical protein [Sinorhizobium medicae]MDX0579818.1 hypothetical protein [Sinorhizobium medicae]MDX0783452.1 hypothetical protein [Sinorhizobium medicae]
MTDMNTGADLLRAANRIQHLSRAEIREHLHHSITTIRDMRIAVGIPGSGTEQDSIIDLLEISTRTEMVPEEKLRTALLEAADMIRTLRIVADSGVTLRLIESDLQANK